MLTSRGKLWRQDRRPGWLLSAGILLLAALVERRWPLLPAADLQNFYIRWSATIGELSHVSLTNPIWLEWLGGFALLAPVLLVGSAKSRTLPRSMGALLLVTFGLTIWQARWGYFLALILCLTIPVLLTNIRSRWLRLLLSLLAFAPFLFSWDRTLWPSEEVAAARATARREAVEWRVAATTLRSSQREPFVAPWWLAPSAAYWSGQPSVAGSSHESLTGIVASARFFLSTAPNEAFAILKAHGVRTVLAYNGTRTAQNSAAILGTSASPQALCFVLDRNPAGAPSFLRLREQNGSAKVYAVGC